MKCDLCNRTIESHQKAIRLVAEVVSQAKGEGPDARFWTEAEDWELVTGYHLSCVKRLLRTGKNFLYQEEISALELDDIVEQEAPVLRLVR